MRARKLINCIIALAGSFFSFFIAQHYWPNSNDNNIGYVRIANAAQTAAAVDDIFAIDSQQLAYAGWGATSGSIQFQITDDSADHPAVKIIGGIDNFGANNFAVQSVINYNSIPYQVTAIGEAAFQRNGSNNLLRGNLTFPSDNEPLINFVIDNDAFANQQLASVIIPSENIFQIGNQAFSDCTIDDLEIENNNAITINQSAFDNSSIGIIKLDFQVWNTHACFCNLINTGIVDLPYYSSITKQNLFNAQNDWIITYNSPIPAGKGFTLNQSQLTTWGVIDGSINFIVGPDESTVLIQETSVSFTAQNLNIHNFVTYGAGKWKVYGINQNAFTNKNLTGTLTLPESLGTINNGAFSSNQFSGELIIPENMLLVGIWAFDTTTFSTLTINSNQTTFNTQAFLNMANLQLINLPFMDWPEKNDGIFALLNSSLNGTVRVPTGSTITLEQLGLAASGKWAIEYYEPTPPVNPDQQDSLLWIYIAIAAGTFVLLAATIIIIIIKRKKGKGKAKAANNKNEKVQKTKKIANPKAKKAPTKKKQKRK